MHMRHIFLAIATLLASFPSHAAPTRNCNPNPNVWLVDMLYISPALQARVANAVASPAADPSAAALLGDVKSIELRTFSWGPGLILHYDPVEDVQEITDRVNATPEFRSQMNWTANTDGHVACFAAGSFPAQRQVVTEYHNAISDHYFLSSSDEENAAIDSGRAGPGWSRTGEGFVTYFPENCVSPRMSKAVYRFYGTPGIGANSHFFTAGPQECGLLRNGVGWTYEGRAFGAELASQGACPANAPVPVYRAYNMRWAQNDSNHRHTTSLATYQQMIARGWAGEGIAFCVPAN
jgi:hypothetical protein